MNEYYDTLNINKSAGDVEIKNAYRRLAMKFHPDRNAADDASKSFSEISEAYDVLSNKLYRAMYDQLGRSQLKAGGFAARDPHLVFEEFFGTKNPFATIDYKQLLQDEKKVPLPDAIYNLECTLAELYTGCIKKVDITRKVLSPATEESPQRPYKEESKILTIVVKPGWKVGTKVVFPKEGDQSETAPAPANVIFVITLKRTDTVDPTGSVQSDTHKWDISGDDLIYTHRLNLIEALTGGTIHITTLDGRVLSIACPEIVSPTYEKRVAGEGMPLYKTPTVKGDLIIRFDIRFPQQLSLTNKDKLKAILK